MFPSRESTPCWRGDSLFIGLREARKVGLGPQDFTGTHYSQYKIYILYFCTFKIIKSIKTKQQHGCTYVSIGVMAPIGIYNDIHKIQQSLILHSIHKWECYHPFTQGFTFTQFCFFRSRWCRGKKCYLQQKAHRNTNNGAIIIIE